jgi:hypothetical protein
MTPEETIIVDAAATEFYMARIRSAVSAHEHAMAAGWPAWLVALTYLVALQPETLRFQARRVGYHALREARGMNEGGTVVEMNMQEPPR